MSPTKNRFVLLCQNALVSATVVAVAAPAMTVGSLDIVAPSPGAGPAGGSAPRGTGALVAAEPVEPEVTEERVDGVEQGGLDALTDSQRAQEKAKDDLAALSAPEPVEGYATVGVTWEPGAVEDDGDITVSVRSLRAGEWSQWEEVEYHDEHGPDPDSAEARNARPGTEAVVVGDVDEVQVKAVTASGEAPQDMKLAVIDPGETEKPIVEEPAIDVMGQRGGRGMWIFPGNGKGGFRNGYVAHSPLSGNHQLGAGLFDGDGAPDSVVRQGDGDLVLYPGNGPGGLTGGRKIGGRAGGYDWMLGVGDADGDRKNDIIARERSTGHLWLIPGGWDLERRRFIGSGFGRYDLGG